MLKGFYCPDGQTVDMDENLSACVKCRLGNRCHSLTYLASAGYDRPFKGKFSTTQLLPENGLRYTWLKIKKDYYIKPEDRAFAILGTHSHAQLDQWAKKLGLTSEFFFKNEEIGGVLDRLEPSPIDDTFWIYDTKTWGNYALEKAYRGETENVTYQLNDYRIKAENSQELADLMKCKIKVSKLLVEAIVRDGGTKKRNYQTGVWSQIPKTKIIEVEIIPDDTVIYYFKERQELLLKYVNDNEMPPMCTSIESWNSRRCKNY
jgi:hypothetical protein